MVVGVNVLSVEFFKVFREVLVRLKKGLEEINDKKVLVEKMVSWFDGVLVVDGLDEGIKMVL